MTKHGKLLAAAAIGALGMNALNAQQPGFKVTWLGVRSGKREYVHFRDRLLAYF